MKKLTIFGEIGYCVEAQSFDEIGERESKVGVEIDFLRDHWHAPSRGAE